MSNISNSASRSSSSAGWHDTEHTGDSSFATDSSPFEFPRRVQPSKPRPESMRKEQQRHLAASSYVFGTLAYPDVEDFDLEWQVPPQVDLAQELLDHIVEKYDLPLPKGSVAKFLNNGDFNRLFLIELPAPEKVGCVPKGKANPDSLPQLILRIPLPLDPYYAMESEVATMTFARLEAGLPVPRVFFFDSSAENPFGLEWMILEFMEGEPLDSYYWRKNDPDTAKISHAIMESLGRLGERKFDQIGSLFCDWDTREYFIGPSAHYEFIRGPRVFYNNRGPFSSLEEYFGALIGYHIRDAENLRIPDTALCFDTAYQCVRRTKSGKRKGSKKRCFCRRHIREEYRRLAIKLRDELLPPFMKRIKEMNDADGLTGPLSGYSAVLHHTDLHENNLLIKMEESGTEPSSSSTSISAIIDWGGFELAPRCLVRPAPKLAVSLEFDDNDLCCYPTGEREGPSLQQMLAGNARSVRAFGSPFMPPVESRAPQGVALLAFQIKLRRMSIMDHETLEWFDEAIAFLNPGTQPEDDESDSDDSGDSNDSDDWQISEVSDDDGDSDSGAAHEADAGSDKDEPPQNSPPHPAPSDDANFPPGYSKWTGPGGQHGHKCANSDLEEVPSVPSPPPPNSAFVPQLSPAQMGSLQAARQNIPQPFDRSGLENVPLGPNRPKWNVRLHPYSSQGPMMVPLRELVAGYTNVDHIYRWNRNAGVPSMSFDAPVGATTDTAAPANPQWVMDSASILRAFCCA